MDNTTASEVSIAVVEVESEDVNFKYGEVLGEGRGGEANSSTKITCGFVYIGLGTLAAHFVVLTTSNKPNHYWYYQTRPSGRIQARVAHQGRSQSGRRLRLGLLWWSWC